MLGTTRNSSQNAVLRVQIKGDRNLDTYLCTGEREAEFCFYPFENIFVGPRDDITVHKKFNGGNYFCNLQGGRREIRRNPVELYTELKKKIAVNGTSLR